MILSKHDIVKQILNNRLYVINNDKQKYFAPINIALIKYWGKKDDNLNLALTPSLSVSSRKLGTTMQIFAANNDEIKINDKNPEANVYKKTFDFIDLWRDALNFNQKICIVSKNNIPTASGLASSASSFACLTEALNGFFSLNLSPYEMSILARLGSGSACRSVFKDNRFAIWDGEFAVPFHFLGKAKTITDNMNIIVCVVDEDKKNISSRDAMMMTKKSLLNGKNKDYQNWLIQTKKDFIAIQNVENWEEFGEIVERNSLLMHKAIQSAEINYFNKNTNAVIEFARSCRNCNKNVYLTIDAGANVKLLYQRQDEVWLKKQIIEFLLKYGICKRILNF